MQRADALLTNFRPGVPERLGFGYDEAIRINPRLIYLYAASYGSKGPQRHRAAFHSTPNALSGGRIIQADSYPDPIAALAAASAISLGLLARERTGKGQYIETSMLCTAGYALSPFLVHFEGSSPWRFPHNDLQGASALCRIYECQHGRLLLNVIQDAEWHKLVGALRSFDLDPGRFGSKGERVQADEELVEMLSGIFLTRDASTWEALLRPAGIPALEITDGTFGAYLLSHGMLSEAESELGPYYRFPARVQFDGSPEVSGASCSVGILSR
jgi:crotonobetainyl-CoA:carnitine CoA-transferase CaiB-like acyl-CoA transferase